ncbi:DNA alkylation repair protein [Paenisporosarcina sp. OV554]|uniref:DNA alkylation repair protein n=1 Tax=Paenisporosarcina sp. OV554 TaxID=2135694 RepID=UPI000D3531F4|nr:DNA alkylation repair protein [Paenisporosarcina sp. OV554]PUB10576.1 3-methyladenine DNA glycosylase AlkD [Paenisporosarcina sp. OV554]
MKQPWNRHTYVQLFKNLSNDQLAEPMKAYMKHHFPFLGIKSPARTEALRNYFSTHDIPEKPELLEEVWNIYQLPEREYQYVAIALLSKKLKTLSVDDLGFLEKLITKKSWWDSVDSIAPTIVGDIVKRDRKNGEKVMLQWSDSDNMWLNRAAILHQLKYKKDTDEKVLIEIITKHKNSNEFFIQKAIGWVLREYAKTNPVFVQQFVASHELKPLSKREALKHLK